MWILGYQLALVFRRFIEGSFQYISCLVTVISGSILNNIVRRIVKVPCVVAESEKPDCQVDKQSAELDQLLLQSGRRASGRSSPPFTNRFAVVGDPYPEFPSLIWIRIPGPGSVFATWNVL
jgi:hypothetical protein